MKYLSLIVSCFVFFTKLLIVRTRDCRTFLFVKLRSVHVLKFFVSRLALEKLSTYVKKECSGEEGKRSWGQG